MAGSLDVQITGAREVTALLRGMTRRTQDMSPALREAAQHIRREWTEAFNTAGRNLPRPWRPLSSATSEAKHERGYDPRVLVRRGDLMQSLTQRGHARHVESVSPGELRIGTRSPVVPLLRHHGRDPVQPPQDMGPIARILERWIVDGKA